MRWLAALALLLLSGCWYGGDFYTVADLRPGLPAGRYTIESLTERPGEAGTALVRLRPDGFTEFVPINRDGREDPGDTIAFGLIPIDPDGRLFAAWLVSVDEPGLPNTAGLNVYGALRRNADGSSDFLQITCDGLALEAARQAGAQLPGEDRPYCLFESRQALEAGLRAVAPDLADGFRLRPAAP